MLQPFAPEAAFQFEERVECRLDDPLAVFRHFFHRELPPQIKILPSENYLYLNFTDGAGRSHRGCMSVSRKKGDEHGVYFSYVDRETLVGKLVFLDASDGLVLNWLDRFAFELIFEGQRRQVSLNQLAVRPPAHAKFRESECYVGPCYDEAGLAFALCFDHDSRCFFWVLNEDEDVAESFIGRMTCLDLGTRTKYVFLRDAEYGRRILIGVSAHEKRANSYFDGPFDQLPDNHIWTGEVQLRKYIELNNPDRRYQIDEFGYFKMMKGCRVAIFASYSYECLEDLDRVAQWYIRRPAGNAFYTRLFSEMNQGLSSSSADAANASE